MESVQKLSLHNYINKDDYINQIEFRIESLVWKYVLKGMQSLNLKQQKGEIFNFKIPNKNLNAKSIICIRDPLHEYGTFYEF